MEPISLSGAPVKYHRGTEPAAAGNKEPERGFRLLSVINLLNLSWGNHGYENFPESLRYTPPHVRDSINNDQAETVPVEYRGSETGLGYEPSIKLRLDFYQYVAFGYELRLAQNTGEIAPQGYKHDARFKERYISGEDAFTFIWREPAPVSHNFTIGFFPYVHELPTFGLAAKEKKSSGVELSILAEAGLALTGGDTFQNGWDRFGRIETNETRTTAWKKGLAAGLQFQLLNAGRGFIGGIGGGVDFQYFDRSSYALRFTFLAIPLGYQF